MRKKIIFTSDDIVDTYPPLRLDRFVQRFFANTSRTQIQKWITQGAIRVNKYVVAKHTFLNVDDEILVDIPEREKTRLTPHDIPIVFEDDAILVIEKPIGVLVHPILNHQEWTLVDFVREHVGEIHDVGESAERAGIVHRLDRDVSGVMVIAKTTKSYAFLKNQFQNHTVIKEYRAIVHGIPSKSAGDIRFRIAHSETQGGKMAARPEHAEGKESWTEYDILEKYNKRFSLLAVRIHTGRTHQIRVHLSAINHPVVGDRRYTSGRYSSRQQYPRLFLHAYRLNFQHPTLGQNVEYVSTLPEAFYVFAAQYVKSK